MKRLAVFALLAAFAIAAIACESKTTPVATPAPAPGDAAKPAPGGGELVIFSWWTAGGEADGLNELIKFFEAKNPGVKVVNAAVAGDAGTNAKAVLKTRMLGGDAPGTFQVHGGSELLDGWVKPGHMAPITKLFDDNGWRTHFPAQLLDMVSANGEIYAVPSNVHRGNALWYNKALFDANGLKPPATVDEWMAVCKTLKDKGVTPLSLASRNKWEVLHLFESLLVAAGGADFYEDLFAGKIAWTDERVKKALTLLKDLLPYVNDNHATMTWDQASGMVQEGKAAMNVMGDWAKGYFEAHQWVADKDYGAVPTPGTVGVFFVVTDTFGLPAKAPNPQATLALLRVIGSVEGQAAFNPKKGSIPARTDVPMDAFDPIAKSIMTDFGKDVLVPSAAHGSAVAESFVISLNDQLSVFIQDKDVEKSAAALEAEAKDLGVRAP